MFLLDTNILSAVMGSRPAPEVAAWMARRPLDLLFTAAVCQAEILSGIAVLPKGRRRDGLEMAALAIFREDFAGRVLPFDTEAAFVYADIFAARRAPDGHGRSDDRVDRPRARRECGYARHRRVRRLRPHPDRSLDEFMRNADLAGIQVPGLLTHDSARTPASPL